MVRSENWKLVHFLDEKDGQLFDLKNDPGETINLWNNQEFEEPKKLLLENLREWPFAEIFQQ